MENLHALAVPSGPTNGVTTNGAGPMNFAELQRRKSNLEQELEALSGVLESVCPALIHGIFDMVDLTGTLARRQHGNTSHHQ